MKLIDAHIHLDHYDDDEIIKIMEDSNKIEAMISVSFNLESCKRNLLLSRSNQNVYPAFGFHPEQPIPNLKEISELIGWMNSHLDQMIAVGEVGLPYYLRKERKIAKEQIGHYIHLLELFIYYAKEWGKPIVLHAVYEDAPIVCDLLEKHCIQKAHFHWFKGDLKTINRMIQNGYFISVTPDVVYEEEIQHLVRIYPLEQLMVETDGPWPFEGPFNGKMTHPKMICESINMIARLKNLSVDFVEDQLLKNTKNFYQI